MAMKSVKNPLRYPSEIVNVFNAYWIAVYVQLIVLMPMNIVFEIITGN